MAFTKRDGTTVARIGRVVEAYVVDSDGEGTGGYFVRVTTPCEVYDGPIYDTLGEAARRTPGLPLAARQALYAGLDYSI